MNFVKLEDIETDQNNNDEIKNKKSKLIDRQGVYLKGVKKKEKIIPSQQFSNKLKNYTCKHVPYRNWDKCRRQLVHTILF